MTRLQSPQFVKRLAREARRTRILEMAHTAKVVAGAICMSFAAVASAAIAVGTIHIVIGTW